jgi:hypothetical protein
VPLARVKVWSLLEVLTSAAQNAEFQNIVDYINNTVLGATSHVHDGTDAAKITFSNLLGKPYDKNAFVFPITGNLTVGTDKAPLKHEMWENGTIIEVRAVCRTAPTGQAVKIDINDDGASIWSAANVLQIAVGNTAGNTSTINNPAVAKGSILTIDVDQIGSGVAGADLTVYVTYQVELT